MPVKDYFPLGLLGLVDEVDDVDAENGPTSILCSDFNTQCFFYYLNEIAFIVSKMLVTNVFL